MSCLGKCRVLEELEQGQTGKNTKHGSKTEGGQLER